MVIGFLAVWPAPRAMWSKPLQVSDPLPPNQPEEGVAGNTLWRIPKKGWSSRTPSLAASEPAGAVSPRTPAGDPRPAPLPPSSPPANPESGHGPCGPEVAWRRICDWVGEELPKRKLPGEGPITVSVSNSAVGYRFAFGTEELCERLQAVPKLAGRVRAAGAEPSEGDAAVHCEVAVVAVEPDESVTLAIRSEEGVLAEGVFDVRSPWPAWFAARTEFRLAVPLIVPGILALACIAWSLWAWRRSRLDHAERLGLAAAAILAIVLGFFVPPHPTPQPASEIGGTIEFVLPADESLKDVPGLRRLANEACASVFHELARCTPEGKLPAELGESLETPSYWRRLEELLRPTLLLPKDVPSLPSDVFCLSEMRYLITPSAFQTQGQPRAGSRAGRLTPSEEPRFREILDRLDSAGEPDLPQTLLSPNPGTAFAAIVTDGDHGALLPPEEPPQAESSTRAVVLCPLNPTRDANRDRRLATLDRINWVAAHCANTWGVVPLGEVKSCAVEELQDDGALAELDQHGKQPCDMDLLRKSCWSEDKLTQAKAQAIGREFAALAMKVFCNSRQKTSKTVLHVVYGPRRFLGLGMLGGLFVGLPIWLRRRGMFDVRSILASAIRWTLLLTAGAILVPLVFAVPPLDAFARDAWCYGLSPWTGLRLGTWWGFVGLGLAVGAAFAFWLRQRFRPTSFQEHVAGGKVTWPHKLLDGNDRWRRIGHFVSQWIGLTLFAVAFGWMVVCPVWTPDTAADWWSLLPTDYAISVSVGWGLWLAAAMVLWFVTPVNRTS